jgi:hypothetical protein
MSSQQLQFLNLRNIPARLTSEEAGWFLGFPAHAMPILVAAGLLKPLGQPVPNATKYYATITLCDLKQDANWLFRASKEITQYWRTKNVRKNSKLASQNSLAESV